MMLPHITVEGRMVADPELRYSPSGVAVAKFRLVAASRKKVTDEQGQEKWEDDKTLWLQCTAFKRLAENIVESVQKGDLVVVTGRLQTDEWTNEQNEKRSQIVCLADTVSLSLAFRTIPAGTGKAERTTGTPADDPWATPAPGAQSEEPPF